MKQKRYSEEQIIQILKEAEAGMPVVRNPVDREHSFWLNVNTDSGSS